MVKNVSLQWCRAIAMCITFQLINMNDIIWHQGMHVNVILNENLNENFTIELKIWIIQEADAATTSKEM